MTGTGLHGYELCSLRATRFFNTKFLIFGTSGLAKSRKNKRELRGSCSNIGRFLRIWCATLQKYLAMEESVEETAG
jgi:hypothetical protein